MNLRVVKSEIKELAKEITPIVRLIHHSLQRGQIEERETLEFKKESGHRYKVHPWGTSMNERAGALQNIIDQLSMEPTIPLDEELKKKFEFITESGNAVERIANGGISVLYKGKLRSYHIKCCSLERQNSKKTRPMEDRIPVGGSKIKNQFADGIQVLPLPGFGPEDQPDHVNFFLGWDRHDDGSFKNSFLLAKLYCWGSKKSEVQVKDSVMISFKGEEVFYDLPPSEQAEQSFG